MTSSPQMISYVAVSLLAAAGTSRWTYHWSCDPAAQSWSYQIGPLTFHTTKAKALHTCSLISKG